MPKFDADYIIVGLGAAGCAAAYQLLKAGKSVLGVEAGPDYNCSIPLLSPVYVGSLQTEYYPFYFWQQQSVANGRLTDCIPCSAKCSDRKKKCMCDEDLLKIGCAEVRPASITNQPARVGFTNYTTGRLLNGGAAINGEQYVRGSWEYWNQWASIVRDEIWSGPVIKRTYDKLMSPPAPTSTSKCRSTIPIRTETLGPTDTLVTEAIINTWNSAFPDRKIGILSDYNATTPGETNGGVLQWQLFQNPDGSRTLPSVSLRLSDYKRYSQNLETTVLRILFDEMDDKKAIGVEVLQKGSIKKWFAEHGVIVTCGVFSAPLLQRSGIGPAKLLSCNRIPVRVSNPWVGRNMHNHLIMRMFFNVDPSTPLCTRPARDQYTGGAFLPVIPLPDSSGIDPRIRGYELFGVVLSPTSFLLLLIWLQPQSSGQVRVASEDPLAPVLPDNNYYGSRQDLDAWLVLWDQILKPLVTTFLPSTWQLTSPPPDIFFSPDTKVKADWILSNVDQTHHWTGTNRMASTSEDGVVDTHGRVFGTKSLYVADASVAPIQPDGNTCAPAYVIGTTIARLISQQSKV